MDMHRKWFRINNFPNSKPDEAFNLVQAIDAFRPASIDPERLFSYGRVAKKFLQNRMSPYNQDRIVFKTGILSCLTDTKLIFCLKLILDQKDSWVIMLCRKKIALHFHFDSVRFTFRNCVYKLFFVSYTFHFDSLFHLNFRFRNPILTPNYLMRPQLPNTN